MRGKERSDKGKPLGLKDKGKKCGKSECVDKSSERAKNKKDFHTLIGTIRLRYTLFWQNLQNVKQRECAMLQILPTQEGENSCLAMVQKGVCMYLREGVLQRLLHAPMFPVSRKKAIL